MKKYKIAYVDGRDNHYKVFETKAETEAEAICNLREAYFEFGDFDHTITSLTEEECDSDESYWTEIRNNFLCDDEDDKFVRIDAWETDDDNEEGKVIAYVDSLSGRVAYVNPLASIDPYAQEMIKEAVREAKKEHPLTLQDMEASARRLLAFAESEKCSLDALADMVREAFSQLGLPEVVTARNIWWDVDMDEVYERLDNMRCEAAAESLGVPKDTYANMTTQERHEWAYDRFHHRPAALDEFMGLPDEVEIPGWLTDDEDITEWLSDTYGFCISGYELSTDEPEADIEKWMGLKK